MSNFLKLICTASHVGIDKRKIFGFFDCDYVYYCINFLNEFRERHWKVFLIEKITILIKLHPHKKKIFFFTIDAASKIIKISSMNFTTGF
jgi:hypothetical protein